jgi:hypothetical protein
MSVDGQSRDAVAWTGDQLPVCPGCRQGELRAATPGDWHFTASCTGCGAWWDVHRTRPGIGLFNGEARVWKHGLGWVRPSPEEAIPGSPDIPWQAVLESLRHLPPTGVELLARGVLCVPAYWAVRIPGGEQR